VHDAGWATDNCARAHGYRRNYCRIANFRRVPFWRNFRKDFLHSYVEEAQSAFDPLRLTLVLIEEIRLRQQDLVLLRTQRSTRRQGGLEERQCLELLRNSGKKRSLRRSFIG
jgi:hypothetical protein